MMWWAKLNKYCLWLALFVVPWQLRHILVWSEHQGEFFEQASISIYLSDILIILTLLSWLLLSRKSKFTIGPRIIFWPVSLLIVWVWVSVWYSQFSTGNWLVGVANAGHLTLFYLFYLYLVNQVTRIQEILLPLMWGCGLQAVVAMGQYALNHSLGLKYLGESVLDPIVVGIPVILIKGVRHLRAHGTLPHANLLGGYLAFVLAWILCLYTRVQDRWIYWTTWVILVLGSGALILSFSRTAWLAWGLIMVVYLVWRFRQRIRWTWPDWLALGLVVGLAVSQYQAIESRFDTTQSALERESVVSRLDQLTQFRTIYDQYPVTGVGIGQYSLYLAKRDVSEVGWHYDNSLPGWAYNLSHRVWDYQPVHNIFLLVLAELGWVGEVLLLLWLLGAAWIAGRLLIKNKELVNLLGLASFSAILILGLFDHYLWTLQQGRLILFLGISIIAVIYQSNLRSSQNYG